MLKIKQGFLKREQKFALLVSYGVAGIYFIVKDKFYPGLRAYFCQVEDSYQVKKL